MGLSSAVRGARAHLGFTALVTVICALTVATTASVFSAVDFVLFRPPAGVQRPAGVFRLYEATTNASKAEVVSRTLSYPEFSDLRARLAPVASVAAMSTESVSIGVGTGASAAIAEFVTSDFLSTLGVNMRLGRGFTADDAEPPAGRAVAVLSERYWRSALGGTPAVIGSRIIVDGHSYAIIGVAAAPFVGIDDPTVDLWMPLAAAGQLFHGPVWDFDRGARWIQVVGRYRGGAVPQSLAAAATQVLTPTASGAPLGRTRAVVGPIQLAWGPGRSLQARVSLWLLGMTSAVLLIGCANIGNLYVVRATARRRELAVRLALGATLRTLFRQLLMETSVPSVLGGALGVAIAAVVNRLLYHVISEPAGAAPHIDLRVLLVAVACTGVVSIIAALLPLAGARAIDINATLRDGSAGATHRSSRLRGSLAAAQVALAALLLVASGLFVHTLHAVFAIDLGMEPDGVLIARVDLASAGRTPEEVDRFYRAALQRLQQLPAVEVASIGTTVPFSSGLAVYLALPGGRSLLEQQGSVPWVNLVTPEFFRSLGMRIVQGRGFTSADRAGTERVAVVARVLAGTLWPGESPIGKCLEVSSPDAPCTRVVGVSADAARDRPTEPPPLQYFMPLDQNVSLATTRALFVKTRLSGTAAAPAVRRALETLDSDVPYPVIVSLSSLIEPHVRPWRTAAALFTTFAVIAVVLAVLGLQTVVAYAVVERRRELAVRLALGGTSGRILGFVLADGLRTTAIGLAVGLSAAAVVTAKAAPLLFGTSTLEPMAYGVAGVTLLVCSVVACSIPALRALSIAPADALRRG